MANAKSTVEAHYDADYFKWQSDAGMLGGQLNAEKFSAYIRPQDAILDFGCGGGYLLASLRASKKLGVEINDVARTGAGNLGIPAVPTLSAAPDRSFDVVISNHALEHTEAPLAVVRELRTKLKPGGTIVVVVPSERYDTAYKPDNIDQHLYTWSAINLGNLFRHAGFEVKEVKRYAHRWPPKIALIDKLFGRTICNLACRFYAYSRPKLTQLRIVATNPASCS